MKKMNKKGFNIVELIIVIAVIVSNDYYFVVTARQFSLTAYEKSTWTSALTYTAAT